MLVLAAQASPAPVLPGHPTVANANDQPAAGRPGQWERWLAPAEIGLGVLVTLASVYFHLLQSQLAGGLWRDEVVSVQVANMPTLGQTWRYLEFDSYPALFHLLLRAWCGLFMAGDTSMRILGLLIGLLLLATFWGAGRALGVRAPLFALGLLALNPIAIRFGDSVRAYGLGCALGVLSLAAIWTVARAERVHWRRVAWAMLVAILNAQCLYHNAALLLGGCLGGALVAWWNRRARVAAATLAIGAPAAISLLPYLPIIHRTRRWSFLMSFPITPHWLWTRLAMVTGSPTPIGAWLWTGLIGGSIGLTGWWLWAGRKHRGAAPSGADCRVFAGLALAAATVVYGGFLYAVGYITQPWYYLAYLGFTAICLDAVFGQTGAPAGWRWFRVAVVAAFSLFVARQTYAALQMRNTSIDIVAANLNANVRPKDLVLVNRWECAISLNRYYHESAPLITIPPIADHAVHRYDLLLDQLMAPDPLRPVFDAVHATLRAGGRVWVVGRFFIANPGESVKLQPPGAFDSRGRWRCKLTVEQWALAVNDDLFRHCVGGQRVPIQGLLPISEFEDVPLNWLSGWREDAGSPTQLTPAVP